MFDSKNVLVSYSAVVLGIVFISLSAIFIKKLFENTRTKDLLVRFILIIFSSLVAVFIVDKVIAFGMPLLSIQQNENLFDLIKTLTLMIFSYYFGTQKQPDKEQI
jgi:uncharacterized membrane protein YwzB